MVVVLVVVVVELVVLFVQFVKLFSVDELVVVVVVKMLVAKPEGLVVKTCTQSLVFDEFVVPL